MSTSPNKNLGFLVQPWAFVYSLLLLALPTAAVDDAGQSPGVYRDWQTFTTRDGLPDNGVRAIAVAGERVWVGTDGGLALYEKGTWQSWTEHDGLPWPAISAVDVSAKTGDVWLGTWGGGVVRFSAGRFDSFTQSNSGLAGDLVFAIVAEGDRIWVSTTGGISVLDTLSGDWKLHFERRADKPEAAFIDLDLDETVNRLYATAWCGAVHYYDLNARRWATIGAEVPCGSTTPGATHDESCTTTTALAPDGENLWLATRSNLYRRHQDGTWEPRLPPIDLGVLSSVNCLVLDRTGLWVGGAEGVQILSDGNVPGWVAYRASESGSVGEVVLNRRGRKREHRLLRSAFPAGQVRSIALQNDTVWVGTANGLARGSDPGHWDVLPIAPSSEPAPTDRQRDVRISRRTLSPSYADDHDRPRTITIASFGPITRTITLPGAGSHEQPSRAVPDSLAIQIAVEHTNKIGGYRGRAPFDATYGTHGYLRYARGLPEDDLALFARRPVFGILASLRPQDRIATAVAFRMELPIVNVAGSIPSVEEEASSWIFRCRGHDPRQHRRMIEYITKGLGRTRLAMLRTPGLMPAEHLDLWKHYIEEARTAGVVLVGEFEYDPASTPLDALLDRVQQADAEAILTWANVSISATVLQTIRRRGMTQLFVGSEQIVCAEFARLMGPEPGAVIAPQPCPHRRDRETMARFTEVYTRQNSPARRVRPPKAAAYRTYDSAGHLMLAISIAGLDRPALREVLAKMGQPTLAIFQDSKWDMLALPSGN